MAGTTQVSSASWVTAPDWLGVLTYEVTLGRKQCSVTIQLWRENVRQILLDTQIAFPCVAVSKGDHIWPEICCLGSEARLPDQHGVIQTIKVMADLLDLETPSTISTAGRKFSYLNYLKLRKVLIKICFQLPACCRLLQAEKTSALH